MRRLIDKIDLEILKILSNDSKITFQDIAKKLDVSNTTIHVKSKKNAKTWCNKKLYNYNRL